MTKWKQYLRNRKSLCTLNFKCLIKSAKGSF